MHTRDESSQWTSPECEIERLKSNIVNEMNAAMNNNQNQASSHHESHFSSSNMDEMNSSYSFVQQSSVAYDSGLQQQNVADCSTTLIKDINHHYEPVELIINRGLGDISTSQMHSHCGGMSSSTYVREIEDFHNMNRPITSFQPVNLIFQKPFTRSGSLPPFASRINVMKSSTRSDFEQAETDVEESYYYCADRFGHHHDHFGGGGCMSLFDSGFGAGGGAESKMTYYKGCIEKRSTAGRPSFKPVELILDASSVLSSDQQQYSGKQHHQRYYYHRRDKSAPSRASKTISSTMTRTSRRSAAAVPIKHRNLVTSSFIYDHSSNSQASSNYDYQRRFINDYDFFNTDFFSQTGGYTTDSGRYDSQDYTISDFVSDQQYQQQQQQQRRGGYTAYKSLLTTEESRKKVSGGEAKYPTMEMTIDLKTPPVIDVPLSNLNVFEGQSARFESVISG